VNDQQNVEVGDLKSKKEWVKVLAHEVMGMSLKVALEGEVDARNVLVEFISNNLIKMINYYTYL
jgi:hypothetical protein